MKKNTAFFKKLKLRLVYDATLQRIKIAGGEKYDLKLHGTDCKQIVNEDLSVYRPFTDKTVRLSFLATEKATGQTVRTVDYTVKIPGFYPMSNRYPKPSVVPELAEWHGTDGVFTLNKAAYAVIDPAYEALFRYPAQALCEDYAAMTGGLINLRVGNDPKAGDIFFTLNQKDPQLGAEGYRMKIGRSIKVCAATSIGAYWATRTILQILKQDADHTAIPNGEIRDYPRYPVRGFMLDAGRRPVSLATLRKIIRNMAWFKMNDLQIHLNDNYIFLEDYYQHKNDTDSFAAYEAFRLESSLKNAQGQTPTAADYAYSKAEFRQLIAEARQMGVRIVPEIDVPAHALSFTKVFPEYMVTNQTSILMKTRPLTDHLDVSRPEVTEFVKQIFDDYTGGENPVFDSDTVVHIGADEFLSDYGAYRRFINELVPYIKKTNPVRVWGGLTWIKDDPVTPIVPEAIQGVQMDLWSKDWADGMEMYQMGYDLINIIDQYVYMVPNGNGLRAPYQDYLPKKLLYHYFRPYKVRMKSGKYATLPAGDKQVLGAAYAIWFDNIDKRASGLTEDDLFLRFYDALPLLSEKTWAEGKEKGGLKKLERISSGIGAAPGTEHLQVLQANYPLGESGTQDTSGAGNHIAACSNAQINPNGQKGLHLNGGASFAALPFSETQPGQFLRFTVTLEQAQPGQILFEGDPAYNTFDIRIAADGKLGFTREGYLYTFDYKLPVQRPVTLELRAKYLSTELVADGTVYKAKGQFLHGGTVKKDGIRNATFALPLSRIGSKTNAVKGVLCDLQIGPCDAQTKRKLRLFHR